MDSTYFIMGKFLVKIGKKKEVFTRDQLNEYLIKNYSCCDDIKKLNSTEIVKIARILIK